MSASDILRADFADLNNPFLPGIAPLLRDARDQDVADLYNARTGPGAATISIPFVEKNEFMAFLTGSAMALATKDAATRETWDRILALAQAAPGPFRLATVGPVLAMAVQSLLTTDDAVNALFQRVGSRAEVLFGPGVTVSQSDVGYSRS